MDFESSCFDFVLDTFIISLLFQATPVKRSYGKVALAITGEKKVEKEGRAGTCTIFCYSFVHAQSFESCNGGGLP